MTRHRSKGSENNEGPHNGEGGTQCSTSDEMTIEWRSWVAMRSRGGHGAVAIRDEGDTTYVTLPN